LQLETQKAALKFERATSSHMAAKEMVRLAEEGLQKDGKIFDSAWQEMLNHSTIRVNECERERVLGQKEHERTSKAYNKSEQLIMQLHQQLKRSIVKARFVSAFVASHLCNKPHLSYLVISHKFKKFIYAFRSILRRIFQLNYHNLSDGKLLAPDLLRL